MSALAKAQTKAATTPATASGACPVCLGAPTFWLEKSGHRLVRCRNCGHGYLADPLPDDHVARHYSDAYFFGGGDGYPDYLAQGPMLRQRGRDYAALIARHRNPGRMIDLGAASGFILKGFCDAGWSGVGVEPNATMRRYGADVLDLTMIAGDAESYRAPTPVDLVAMIQVIGHLRDLNASLKTAAANLVPGGLCLVEYWDRESLAARALGARWHELTPPGVIHWFGRKDLARLFAAHGFSMLDAGRPKKRIAGAHAASLLAHTLRGAPGLAWLAPLTKVIPARLSIPYPPVDLRWALFRKDRP